MRVIEREGKGEKVKKERKKRTARKKRKTEGRVEGKERNEEK